MPKRLKSAEKTVLDEHIFAASRLEPMAIRYRELREAKRDHEAMQLLEQIIIESTDMFKQLAQFSNYQRTVDLNILVSAAQDKVKLWLERWKPKKGRLFSWFSVCAKHAFISELNRVNTFRKRFHVTGDNLEKFHGSEDHHIDKHDVAEEFRQRLNGLHCPWEFPQHAGAVRFIAKCMVDDPDHDRAKVIRTAMYAFVLSEEMARFFYSWCLTALRSALADKAYTPFTEEDLLRLQYSYTYIPQLIDLIGLENTKKISTVFGGQTLRIVSLAQIQKFRQDARILREMEQTDLSPDSLAEVGRKYKKTERAATEIFTEMSEALDPRRAGRVPVFHDDDENYNSGHSGS